MSISPACNEALTLSSMIFCWRISVYRCLKCWAVALCERLNARAPNTLASIKELVNEAPLASLHQQLGLERDLFVRNLHHANGGDGIAAFLGKRPAQYR